MCTEKFIYTFLEPVRSSGDLQNWTITIERVFSAFWGVNYKGWKLMDFVSLCIGI